MKNEAKSTKETSTKNGRFDGKVAIITGGGSGIGLATAKRLLYEGATVVLASRSKERLEKAAKDLPSERVLIHPTDVSISEQCQALVDATLERFGKIDILVNSAGQNITGSIDEISEDNWHTCIGADQHSVFFMTKAALPYLKQTKGSVVNIGSVSSVGGGWSHVAYCAAKAAVANFSKAAACDTAADGVRINTICPGLTDTPMVEPIMSNQKVMEKAYDRIPMKRVAQPEEIASAIAFMASDDASYITGAVLTVDGGLSITDGGPNWNA